jgi:hypothetical protein
VQADLRSFDLLEAETDPDELEDPDKELLLDNEPEELVEELLPLLLLEPLLVEDKPVLEEESDCKDPENDSSLLRDASSLRRPIVFSIVSFNNFLSLSTTEMPSRIAVLLGNASTEAEKKSWEVSEEELDNELSSSDVEELALLVVGAGLATLIAKLTFTSSVFLLVLPSEESVEEELEEMDAFDALSLIVLFLGAVLVELTAHAFVGFSHSSVLTGRNS